MKVHDTTAAGQGKPPKPANLRAAGAAVFLVLVLAAVPAVMLGWGRMGSPPMAADDRPRAAVIPPEGARWDVELSREDGDRLLEVFFASWGAPEGEGDGPERDDAGVPVFVTVYAPNAPPARACGRGRTVADGVRDAAGQLRPKGQIAPDAGSLRVRIDVLQEAQSFTVEQRLAFAQRMIGEPAGVALQSGGRMFWFLPAEMVDCPAPTNEALLGALCQRAGLEMMRWRSPEVAMWRLRGVGFVNSAPGQSYALASVRGLTALCEPTVARLLRACRTGAGYLLRVQQEDGRFVTYRGVTTGLQGGCETVTEHAGAAGALAMLARLRPNDDYVEAAYDCLSFAMSATDTDAQDPAMAFTRRQEVCVIAFELETTAQVLEALCRYRRVSGLTAPDEWIAATARFLLFMQRDDGLFDLAFDARSREKSNPGKDAASPVPQAKAAAALLLAYGELGVPGYLVAAQRALKALHERATATGAALHAREARWLAVAIRECGGLAGDLGLVEWLGEIAAERRKAQMLPADAPGPDLVGATLESFPPGAQATADDLVVFTAACMMEAPGRAENLAAARRAAAWLMHLQYLPENSYYLPDADAVEGGIREHIGGNFVRVQTIESTLRGMTALVGLQLQDNREHDREG